MVIFIFQGIWLFIDKFAGKGLGIDIIAQFILFYMPSLMDKVLPLTVLLSSILTFGNFAENYEFAAMKASGISLQRAIKSLFFFVILLGGVTFFFANNVMPVSEQKIFNMRRNIAQVKPAAAITEGVFSDFEGTAKGMNIKVDRKYGEDDRFLDNIIIHQKVNNINTTVIKANNGELVSEEGSDIIQLLLYDGHYFRETRPKSAKERKKHPFVKSKFETYTINIDISELNNQDLTEESDITTDKMKNVSRLLNDIDSLRDNNLGKVTAFSKNIMNRIGGFPSAKKQDSLPKSVTDVQRISQKRKIKNPIRRKVKNQIPIAEREHIIESLPDFQQIQILNNAKSSVGSILTTVRAKKEELGKRYKFYNSHIISLHKKYALAFSCIILFFVGAPLGALIRKGGLGLPMVIAIVLFLVYYFIGVFAVNYAKEGNIHPILGAWLSTLIMLPLSISLTRRAALDKNLMRFSAIFDVFTKLFKRKEKQTQD